MRRSACCLALAWSCALGVCADEPTVPYTVAIEGVADSALENVLGAVSDAMVLQKRPPATFLLLRRRVDRDIPRFIQVLKAHGYYGATVTADIDENAAPVLITFQVDPGPAYLLASVDVHIVGGGPDAPIRVPDPAELGLLIGEPARTDRILGAQRALLDALQRQGLPFPKIVERRIEVDHAAPERGVSVLFRVEPGPSAEFGETVFTGLAAVDEGFLRGQLPWRPGNLYNRTLLDELQARLTNTGLFATARVTPGEALDATGRLPVRVTVAERKPRTLGAGIGYKTDEGLGSRVWWEHRNLLGCGERLHLDATVSEIEYSVEGRFRKPAFRRPDQSLILILRIAKDRPDAFESSGLSAEAAVERVVSDRLKLRGGLAFRDADVKQFRRTRHFTLFAVPLYGEWDNTDETFDPTRGVRIDLELAPFFDVTAGDLGFIRGKAGYAHYLAVAGSDKLILAARTAAGALVGGDSRRVPADERFYAGGGGSIRGYPYQSVGPVRRDDPVGGCSLLEVGAELRYRLNDRLGLVAFLDGGTAMQSEIPDFGEPLRWGAGIGARYYTPVGPLRFDVGIPLNPPEHVDDRFQVYLSLGHAF